jgi:carboxylesterase
LSEFTENVKHPLRGKLVRRIGAGLGALLVLLVLAVAVIYTWPLGSNELQHAEPKSLSYAAASAQAEQIVRAESADPQVLPECRSQILSHGAKSAKAVLLLHGYTDCPKQYSSLAKLYFDKGYNVYVPRAPRHGVVDKLAHAKLTADELVTYANDSMNIVAGLGNEVGVVGISGGAVLATWLAEYRADVVQHLLVLSPFYQPNSAQAPSFAIKPLVVLFGFRILPDYRDSLGFSYAALSQYLRITRNYEARPKSKQLKDVAVVVSANDDLIDRRVAVDIPRQIAAVNKVPLGVHELPAALGIGHDIATPDQLKGKTDQLAQLYFDLYEGTRKV